MSNTKPGSDVVWKIRKKEFLVKYEWVNGLNENVVEDWIRLNRSHCVALVDNKLKKKGKMGRVRT